MKKLDKFNVVFFWFVGCMLVFVSAIGFMMPGFFSIIGIAIGLVVLAIAPPILFTRFWNRYIAKE